VYFLSAVDVVIVTGVCSTCSNCPFDHTITWFKLTYDAM